MQTGTFVSLAIYFLAMLGIGLYSYKKSDKSMSGYMLGGRQMSPAVTALSAGASDMSGWMLLGLPGAMFVSGVSSVWIAIGLLIGAYFNYLLVAPRLRVYTAVADDALTIPDFFAKRFDNEGYALRVISSIVIIIFFTLYTSSGVVAGGKLFESSFGLSYELGLYITAGVVVAYTLFGGFMAVSITDFVQGCIMFIALILVPIVALTDIGGLSTTTSILADLPGNKLNLLSGVSIMAIISSMAWGLGYFGQPHIVVRFMAIRSVTEVKTARRIGMSWMLVTLIGASSTGLVGAAYVSQNGIDIADPETIFVLLSQLLFSPLIGGFLLAAILAAIMSTISSQLLVSSSSLTEDFYKIFVRRDASQKELVTVGRLSVLLVAIIAIALAYNRDSSILTLVSNAWAGFGAAFGPIILLSLFWAGLTRTGAISGMLAGAITVLFWIYAPITIGEQSLSGLIYEIVPGFIIGGSVAILASKFSGEVSSTIQSQYAQMTEEVQNMS
ncbi:sodium/proline symporter PutP [Alteromonadaceae bacterium M269]|nr:sodium/proline symporter PutP [Alteromonadaceae bacterium M269]